MKLTEEHVEKMVEMFGEKLPDPHHQPLQFQYFAKLYWYENIYDSVTSIEINTQNVGVKTK